MTGRLLLGLCCMLPFAAWAADEIKPLDIKPGLWEATVTMEMTGLPAMPAMPQIDPETLAKMPPQQRAQIENMMKGRGGSPRTTTTKFCITQEAINRAHVFDNNNNKNCSYKVISSTSSKVQAHVDCVDDRTKMTTTGDMNFERVDSEHIQGSMVMKSSGNDRAVDMKSTYSNKWLSSDCGDVKPAGEK